MWIKRESKIYETKNKFPWSYDIVTHRDKVLIGPHGSVSWRLIWCGTLGIYKMEICDVFGREFEL